LWYAINMARLRRWAFPPLSLSHRPLKLAPGCYANGIVPSRYGSQELDPAAQVAAGKRLLQFFCVCTHKVACLTPQSAKLSAKTGTSATDLPPALAETAGDGRWRAARYVLPRTPRNNPGAQRRNIFIQPELNQS